jgi:hypothetical protein
MLHLLLLQYTASEQEATPFVVAGVARYAVTTIDPGRVHPALADVFGVDDCRVHG